MFLSFKISDGMCANAKREDIPYLTAGGVELSFLSRNVHLFIINSGLNVWMENRHAPLF